MRFVSNYLSLFHRSWIIVGLACWLASAGGVLDFSGDALFAQDQPGERPQSHPDPAAASNADAWKLPEVLPREAAELEIALGRLRLVPDRFRIVRKHEQFDWPFNGASKACTRSMQVTMQDNRPTVKLSYADPQERWTLAVDAIVGAEWTRELLATPAAKTPICVRYWQRPHQSIQVTIEGVDKQPIKLTAATLWHMTEQKSPAFEQYVLPALVRLNSSWDLPRALAAAKRMRGSIEQSSSAKHELAQSIAELDSVDRRVREAAKQKLRDAGLAAQIPLEQLRCGPLSPQQRSTVDELLGELEPRSADTPTRLAYWLSGDPNWR